MYSVAYLENHEGGGIRYQRGATTLAVGRHAFWLMRRLGGAPREQGRRNVSKSGGGQAHPGQKSTTGGEEFCEFFVVVDYNMYTLDGDVHY